MKAAISLLNQSGLKLDDEAVRTIQAASRPDWNPAEQLVLVTIPNLANGLAIPASERSLQRSLAVDTVDAASPIIPESHLHHRAWIDESDTGMMLEPIPAGVEKVQTPAVVTAEPDDLTESESQSSPPSEEVGQTANRNHSAVVESLAVRFELAGSFAIHLCDIDHPLRPAEVCLSVGLELAERLQRRILLIDVSRTSRPLSGLLGVDLAAGFREVIRTELNWRQLVRPTSHPLVEVLPAGVIKLNSSTGNEYELAVRRLMSEVAQTYGGILTCADSAYDPETALVGMCSSGGFLTIDFQRTSRGLAQAAAKQLQATGHRLLGCIAASLAD